MNTSPGIDAIRPMSLSDIIDAAIRMYRHNFGPFLGIVALAYVPVILGQMLLLPVMMTGLSSSGNEAEQLAEALPILAVFGLLALTSMLSVPLSQAALIWAISERYLGRSCGVKDAYKAVIAKLGPVLLVMILVGLAAFAGLLLCIIPGIVVGTLYTFAVAEVMVNGQQAIAAMQRSWNLVLTDFWKVFVTLLVLGIIVYIISSILSVPLGLLAIVPWAGLDETYALYAQSLTNGLQVLVSIIVMPVQIIGGILLYYDMRVRHEGFDLQLLAERMEVHGESGARGAVTAKAPSLMGDPAATSYLSSDVSSTSLDSSGEAPTASPPMAPPDIELPPKIDEDAPE